MTTEQTCKLVEDFSGLPEQVNRPVFKDHTIDAEAGIITETNIRPNTVIKAGVGVRMTDETITNVGDAGLYIDTMIITDPVCAFIRDNVVIKKLSYAETHEFFAFRRLPRVGQAHNCRFVFRKNDDGTDSDIVDLITCDVPVRKGTELCVDYGFPYYARLFIVKRLFDMKYNITNWTPSE